MRSTTHIAFSQLLYLLLVSMAGLALSPAGAAAAGIASLAPDIDSGSTLAGRICPPLSRWLETRFGHRTLTHSATAVAALALLCAPLILLERDLYLCLMLGYTSHPVLDSMTVTGVQLFYPFSRLRCVFPLDVKHPYRYRVRTGRRTDTTIAVAMAVFCVPAFLIARSGHGPAIRALQADIESAVREYRVLEHESVVHARLLANHVLSGRELSGTLEVLGAPDPTTLLVLDSTGRMVSVGSRGKAEYVARTVVCSRGEPITTLVREHDMTGRLLGDIVATHGQGDRPIFFGELEVDRWQAGVPLSPWFSPLRQRGSIVTLDHARPEDLTPYAGSLVRRGTIRSILRSRDAPGRASSLPLPLIRRELTGSSFRLMCRQGEEVSEGAPLAFSDEYEEIGRELAVLTERLELLEAEHAADLADLAHRLSSARQAQMEDSIEVLDLMLLEQEGFAGNQHQKEARRRWEASRSALRRLSSEDATRRAHHEVRLSELRTKIARLREGRERAVLHAPSPARVRSILNDEKRLVILLEPQ